MKKIIMAGMLALFGVALWSCDQNQAVSPDSDAATTARLGSDSTGFFCRDSLTKIAVSALPATVTSFISTSYAGATINYAATDDAGNFLVAITRNSQRTALLFNADGTFNRELALRGGGKGNGGHGPGGHRGGDRDSLTSVAVSSLPAVITSYITTNFASATITAAALDATRGYLVMITLNSQRRTLLFGTDGTFTQEIVRGLGKGYTVIEASTLPAVVAGYITANYAGATIRSAGKNSTGQFKVIVLTATGRYAELYFAADGTFVQARTRH